MPSGEAFRTRREAVRDPGRLTDPGNRDPGLGPATGRGGSRQTGRGDSRETGRGDSTGIGRPAVMTRSVARLRRIGHLGRATIVPASGSAGRAAAAPVRGVRKVGIRKGAIDHVGSRGSSSARHVTSTIASGAATIAASLGLGETGGVSMARDPGTTTSSAPAGTASSAPAGTTSSAPAGTVSSAPAGTVSSSPAASNGPAVTRASTALGAMTASSARAAIATSATGRPAIGTNGSATMIGAPAPVTVRGNAETAFRPIARAGSTRDLPVLAGVPGGPNSVPDLTTPTAVPRSVTDLTPTRRRNPAPISSGRATSSSRAAAPWRKPSRRGAKRGASWSCRSDAPPSRHW